MFGSSARNVLRQQGCGARDELADDGETVTARLQSEFRGELENELNGSNERVSDVAELRSTTQEVREADSSNGSDRASLCSAKDLDGDAGGDCDESTANELASSGNESLLLKEINAAIPRRIQSNTAWI